MIQQYFFHAHSYRSSAVILLKILIWQQRYNDERTCTRLHHGYAYQGHNGGLQNCGRKTCKRVVKSCIFANWMGAVVCNGLGCEFMNR